MQREEMPLSSADLVDLQDFVEVVRDEIKETNDDTGRRIERVNYYKLNVIGLMLLDRWKSGKLDELIDAKSNA